MITLVKILFVCHGNVCRSPMAERILIDMVNRRKLSKKFVIASAGTSPEEIGSPIHPESEKLLKKGDIDSGFHKAAQLKVEDAAKYDWIICMDRDNMREVHDMLGSNAVYVTPKDVVETFIHDPAAPFMFNGNTKARVCKLLDFTGAPRDVEDPTDEYAGEDDMRAPWYSKDFETAYKEITSGCAAIMNLV